jgi:alkylated DNA repair dioxygenase AlkB
MNLETMTAALEAYSKSLKIWEKDGSWILYVSNWCQTPDFAILDEDIAWQQDAIKIFGRSIDLPRLTAWYGDAGASYVYSGIRNEPKPWPQSLNVLRQRLRQDLAIDFNSALANRYANGQQHQGYHADDEKELGPSPIIASLSFGSSRRFLVKEKGKGTGVKAEAFDLENGSLLLMGGDLQRDYVHAISKSTRVHAPRINLTFRQIKSRDL